MLLRGANAVGYSNYPDNVIDGFCQMAVDHGMDIFRIFDSLNYLPNMKVGIDAVGKANGVISAAVCYTGDVADTTRRKYSLEYYMKLVDELVKMGIHILSIKGTWSACRWWDWGCVVFSWRHGWSPQTSGNHNANRRHSTETSWLTYSYTYTVSECLNLDQSPAFQTNRCVSVCSDTAGTGVANYLAAFKAGADIVDVAVDSMSGMTSQPTMGGVVAALQNTKHDTGIDMDKVQRNPCRYVSLHLHQSF